MAGKIRVYFTLFLFCDRMKDVGVSMRIGVDESNYKIAKPDGNEYIYIYKSESLEDLKKKKLHCIQYKYCDFLDINTTDYDIDCLKKTKTTEENWMKLDKRDFKIAIIIPNCNYEHTIEKCITSILNQTYQNYEIIFVDDMSTDKSVEIAKQLLKPPHKVIELKQKRLNGGARNEAYLHVSDDTDYIYYVDSDDWLFNNRALEEINNRLQTYPDVLFVGIAECKGGKVKKCNQEGATPAYQNKYEAMQGWSGSCGKVIKKRLATKQECLYPEGTLKEDRNQHYKICINMKSFKNLPKPVYVWNKDNYKSVTKIRDKAIWGTSTIRHYADTLQLYLTYKGQDKILDEILEKRVEQTKNEIINGGDQQW